MLNMDKIVRREQRIQLAVVIALICSFAWIILKVENMLVAFLLALVITYMLKPIVNLMERRGMSRTLAIFIPFMTTGVLVVVSVSILYPMISEQLQELQAEFPKYKLGFEKMLANLGAKASAFSQGDVELNISESINSYVTSSAATVFTSIPGFASKFLTVMMLSPFFAFFLLRDGKSMTRNFLKIVPNNVFELALNLSYQINKQMGDFIRARLLEAGIVGFVVWLGLTIIGFPYASILALFAALTNLIPYVGPFIGAIPTIIIALINNDPGFVIFMVTMTYMVAQLIDIIFIIP